jgi:hypothetical protein
VAFVALLYFGALDVAILSAFFPKYSRFTPMDTRIRQAMVVSGALICPNDYIRDMDQPPLPATRSEK